jgi:hypothetical protein
MSISGNWDTRGSTRREVLAAGAAAAAALARGRTSEGARGAAAAPSLARDPGGLLDLPRGFQYRVLSTTGRPMSDGRPTPADPDGMAAFAGPGGTTVLVRNHEVATGEQGKQPVVGSNPYARNGPGGTTALVVDADRRVVRDYVTSSGTSNNCAGGPTPWGTWLTCEEERDPPHGFVYEVMWDDPENALSKTPIREMGFFSHEAVGVDPATGHVYLTEDDFRARDTVRGSAPNLSHLYRFRPNRTGFAGALQQGGVLEALAVEILRTPARRTADFWRRGQTFRVVWRRVDPTDPPGSAAARGCVRFNRLEGATFRGGAFWFDDTVGGEERLGQIFRYVPARNRLELFLEGRSANVMDAPDNIVVSPWGHLWFCEDGGGVNRVVGVRPNGTAYLFARATRSELAGPTFAPDGRTFFVNAQNRGLTFAVWGPFARVGRGAGQALAGAAPPARYAPTVSEPLAEAAERHGLTRLEAAAFDRLGVPLT